MFESGCVVCSGSTPSAKPAWPAGCTDGIAAGFRVRPGALRSANGRARRTRSLVRAPGVEFGGVPRTGVRSREMFSIAPARVREPPIHRAVAPLQLLGAWDGGIACPQGREGVTTALPVGSARPLRANWARSLHWGTVAVPRASDGEPARVWIHSSSVAGTWFYGLVRGSNERSGVARAGPREHI